MTIGELARRTGLTNSRIRFYESAGLLQTVDRRPNGYRTYPPEAVLVLELATVALALWTLCAETRRVLAVGRLRNRGDPRPPAAPEWPGVVAPSVEDQALMLGSYVFWTACSLFDLL